MTWGALRQNIFEETSVGYKSWTVNSNAVLRGLEQNEIGGLLMCG